MINYALSLILFIAAIPTNREVSEKFQNRISTVSETYGKGQLEEAIDLGNEAYEYASDYQYSWGKTKALFILAFLHSQNEQYEKALPYYFEVLDTYDGFDTPESVVDHSKVLFNLGNIMQRHHKFQEALDFYDKGIVFSQKHQLDEMVLDLLHNKAIACRKGGLYTLALETITQQRLLIADMPEKLLENENQMGLLHKCQEDYVTAERHFRNILKMEQDHPTARYSGKALGNLGNMRYLNGQMEEAEHFYEEAIKLAKLESNAGDLFNFHQSLGLIHGRQNQLDLALQHMEQGLEYYDAVEKSKENIMIHSQLSEVYFLSKNIELGRKHAGLYTEAMVELVRHKENLNNIGNQYKIDYITTNYYNKIEQRKHLNIFLAVVGLMVFSFLVYLGYQHYRKIQIARLIREQLNAVVFDIDDL